MFFFNYYSLIFYFSLDPRRIRSIGNDKRVVARRKFLNIINEYGSIVKVSVPVK